MLITTQSQRWPRGQVLDVPVLDPDVAAGFLPSRAGDPDKAAARELTVELGGLPLALEQALRLHASRTQLAVLLSIAERVLGAEPRTRAGSGRRAPQHVDHSPQPGQMGRGDGSGSCSG